jgi:hypothetical protein
MADSGEKYFDRYEVVAIALPGAVLLFAMHELVHHVPIPFFAAASDGGSLAALGMFAVAAYAMGQVVQAAGHRLEKWWEHRRQSPWSQDVPPNLGSDVRDALERWFLGINLADDSAVRRTRPQLLAAIRASGHAGLMDALKISSSVNRGFCLISAFVAVLATVRAFLPDGVAQRWELPPHGQALLLAVAAGTAAGCCVFWWQYRDFERQREQQIWIQLLRVAKHHP